MPKSFIARLTMPKKLEPPRTWSLTLCPSEPASVNVDTEKASQSNEEPSPQGSASNSSSVDSSEAPRRRPKRLIAGRKPLSPSPERRKPLPTTNTSRSRSRSESPSRLEAKSESRERSRRLCLIVRDHSSVDGVCHAALSQKLLSRR